MTTSPPHSAAVTTEDRRCCIAGCGPAGAMLGLLLARAGVDVLVLEKHDDFFRDFRGDTIHPSTLDLLDELGLLDRFSGVPQQHVQTLKARTDGGDLEVVDFRGMPLRHPYIAFVPQWDFLDFLTAAAGRYPGFELRMGTEVVDLVEDRGRVQGVRYRSDESVHQVRATLTVAADGRDSRVREAAGLEPVRYGAPVDVLWFRLSRQSWDTDESFGRITAGRFIVLLNRGSYWQVGYAVPKGGDAALRSQPVDVLRRSLREALPELGDRAQHEPASWDDVKTLEVQVNRLRRWHRSGLLCIGDAAHAMSPVGGVGINLAIQDAVAAANVLAEPLRRGTVAEGHLARVQRRRWLPTAVTQALQRAIQRRLLPLLRRSEPVVAPPLLNRLARFRVTRRLPARVIGVGVLPEHVRVPEVASHAERASLGAGAAARG